MRHKPWCEFDAVIEESGLAYEVSPCTCDRRTTQRRDGKDRRSWYKQSRHYADDRRVVKVSRVTQDRRISDRRKGEG